MWHDLRFSIRTLAKHPAFTAVAVVVLALGFGINTALFSIVYSVFFKPPPIENPHEVVYLYGVLPRQPNQPTVVGPRVYEYFRAHNEAFAELTAHWGVAVRLTADGQTESVHGEWVLANYFDVLGVKAIVGRTLMAEDDDVASSPLSFWLLVPFRRGAPPGSIRWSF
jgi:putative ABC transport system permease protein